ncbi:hypothetical protein N431DRAFT_496587 [Stipitochalara longipes BDJ]|nr:hypothetical protein N431DRAFT_496587 [Stipitochalara longipes BDJ]
MSRLQSLLSSLQPLDIPPHQNTLLTFTLFPKLAPELQNMIWAIAAFEPRTINIFPLNDDYATALAYANMNDFNLRPETILSIKHVELRFWVSRSRSSDVTRLLVTRYFLLLHNKAKFTSIQFKFLDCNFSYELNPSCLILEDVRCQKTNEEYAKYVSNGLWKGGAMPGLEFV